MSILIGQHGTFKHFHKQDPNEQNFPNLPGSFWSTLSLNQKISGTLHDLYTIPEFNSIKDILAFIGNMQSEQVNKKKNKYIQENSEIFEKQLEKDLVLAFSKTHDYLEKEGFFLTNKIKNAKVDSLSSFLTFYKGIYKQALTNTPARISLCVFLKELTTFFKIIRYPDFSVDYKTGEIDLKNDEFVWEITNFFNNKPFSIENGENFSEKSPYMIGSANIDGRKFVFQASFGVKSAESLAEKIDSQEKYNIIDAVQDLHRMRIEVGNEEEAMRIGKLIFEHFWKNFNVKNVGKILTQERVNEYNNQFLVESPEYRESLFQALETKGEKKATSSNRKELKLVRSGKNSPALEIQIVLRDNTNEIGFAHHDIYRIKRKITKTSRLQGYINSNEIKSVITRVFNENLEKDGKQTIPFTEAEVFDHIIKQKDLLMEIREKKKTARNRFYTTPDQLSKWKENYNAENLEVEGVIESHNARAWQLIKNMVFKKDFKK